MKSMVKQPIVWIGLGVFIVFLVIVLGEMNDSVSISNESQSTAAPDKNLVMDKKQANEQAQTIEHDHETHNPLDTAPDNTMPRHEDMLSEDMKQAIRDKLLFHGPMEVIEHPDGSIELPSKGRFTQMPVAVEMPDGSIQIKEYSVLPK